MKFTIIGSTGFIGSNLTNYLKKQKYDCYTPDIRLDDISKKSLGHVIYTIGTPDFKNYPFDSIETHVCILNRLLQNNNFDSFLYLSGTRLYQRNQSTSEDDSIIVNPTDFNDLYNISKSLGDCLCISMNNPNIRVARLSNVSGNNFNSNLFLPSIVRDAVLKKKIKLFSNLESEKDYIHIDDVVKLLPKISIHGQSNIYNIASGKNTKSKEIVAKISKITKCTVDVESNSPICLFPQISTSRIKKEFNFKPMSVLEKIEDMVDDFKQNFVLK